MKVIKQLTIGLVALAAMNSSYAYMINNAGDAALSGATVVDFEGATTGGYQTVTVDNVTFSTLNNSHQLYLSSAYGGQYNAQGISLQNTYNSNAFTGLRIDFDSPTSAFGFNWGASDATWNMVAYNSSDVVVDSGILPTTYSSNAGEFFGLASAGISYVTLSQNGSGDYIFLDNLHYIAGNGNNNTDIPLPSSLALFGLAAFGLAWRKRR